MLETPITPYTRIITKRNKMLFRFIVLIAFLHENPALRALMLKAPKLYGTRVSEKMVNVVDGIISTGPLFELLEHEKLGFSKMDFWMPGGTEW